MRIVGGSLRGRALLPPADRSVRPTSARAREAVFDHLMHGGYGPGGASILIDAVVVDGFCGTGALGLEALSRGAARVFFIDLSAASLDLARRNAAALGVEAACRFVRGDAADPPLPSEPATVMLLDPPFRDGGGVRAMTALATRGWLSPGGVAAVGRPSKVPAPTAPDGFSLVFSRKYGAGSFEMFLYEV